MKTFSFVVLAGTLVLASCGGNSNEANTSDSISNMEGQAMVQQSDTSMNRTPTVDEKSVDFAIEAANSGMREIELSQWEQDYGTRQDAKEFAAMMITDHSNASAELKKIAASKNINLPNSLPDGDRNEIDKLKTNKQGKEIDKSYVNEMVSDHKKAVKLFEDAAKDVTDPDLRNFAAQTLPVLQKHYEHIKSIKAKL